MTLKKVGAFAARCLCASGFQVFAGYILVVDLGVGVKLGNRER